MRIETHETQGWSGRPHPHAPATFLAPTVSIGQARSANPGHPCKTPLSERRGGVTTEVTAPHAAPRIETPETQARRTPHLIETHGVAEKELVR